VLVCALRQGKGTQSQVGIGPCVPLSNGKACCGLVFNINTNMPTHTKHLLWDCMQENMSKFYAKVGNINNIAPC